MFRQIALASLAVTFAFPAQAAEEGSPMKTAYACFFAALRTDRIEDYGVFAKFLNKMKDDFPEARASHDANMGYGSRVARTAEEGGKLEPFYKENCAGPVENLRPTFSVK